MTEITLDQICEFAGKTPEQLINMLIAAGKANRGHYKTFMKFEEDELQAMTQRIRFNRAIVEMHELNLKIEKLNNKDYPKTISDIDALIDKITTEQLLVKKLHEELQKEREETRIVKTQLALAEEEIKRKPWYKR